jgi:hypothetical protein
MSTGEEDRILVRDADFDVTPELHRAVNGNTTGIVAGKINGKPVVLIVDECTAEPWSIHPAALCRVEQKIVSLNIQVVAEDGHLLRCIENYVGHSWSPWPMRIFRQAKGRSAEITPTNWCDI